MSVNDSHAEPVEWRRLGARLWVGRLDGAPLGIVERGRQYTATDSHERIRGTFKSLAEAQAALTPPSQLPVEPPRPAAPAEPQARLMVAGTSTVAVIAAAMAAVGLTVYV